MSDSWVFTHGTIKLGASAHLWWFFSLTSHGGDFMGCNNTNTGSGFFSRRGSQGQEPSAFWASSRHCANSRQARPLPPERKTLRQWYSGLGWKWGPVLGVEYRIKRYSSVGLGNTALVPDMSEGFKESWCYSWLGNWLQILLNVRRLSILAVFIEHPAGS